MLREERLADRAHPPNDGITGFFEDRDEKVRLSDTDAVIPADRVHDGARDSIGHLALARDRNEPIHLGHHDGSRHVDLRDPLRRIEAHEGGGGLADGHRIAAAHFGHHTFSDGGIRDGFRKPLLGHTPDHPPRRDAADEIQDRGEGVSELPALTRSESTGSRTQDQSVDPPTMAVPEQLRNRAAHRVSNGQNAIDLEGLDERRDVIRTIGEREWRADTHASTMATMVDDEDVIAATERAENRPPIEQTGCAETVQQHQGRCVLGAHVFADKNLASPRERDTSLSPTHCEAIDSGMTRSLVEIDPAYPSRPNRFKADAASFLRTLERARIPAAP